MSTLQGDLPSADISRSPENKVTIEDTAKGKHITVSETLSLHASVHITLGISEELDEEKVIEALSKIIRVRRFETKTLTVKEANLSKALNEYDNAMFAFNRLRIFKYLFNTLEFCANWTGTAFQGSSLDAAIVAVAGVSHSDVEFWRKFYNKTKHVNKTTKDATFFSEGINRLTEILPKIREAAKQLITNC